MPASPPDGSLAERLRALRVRAGLTQEELAERAGLTPHAISALERGTRTRPYPHTLRALADALGLDEVERADLRAAVPSRQAAADTAGPTTPEATAAGPSGLRPAPPCWAGTTRWPTWPPSWRPAATCPPRRRR